jgi:hypothetical protein
VRPRIYALHVAADDAFFEHVAERVEQRTHIRIELLAKIARKKSELFAGFDCRTRQHQTRDFAILQRTNGHRDREKGLTGSGRTDSNRQRVALNRVDELALPARARTNFATTLRAQ